MLNFIFILMYLINQVSNLQADDEVMNCYYPSILDPEIEKLFTGVTSCRFFTRHGFYNRPPLQTDNYGQITPYWAQELSGLDLSKDYLERYQQKQKNTDLPSLKKVNFGIIDEGLDLSSIPADKIFNQQLRDCLQNHLAPQCADLGNYPKHGSAVANLIIGKAPIGTTLHTGLSCASPLFPSKAALATQDFFSSTELLLKKIDEIKGKCIDDPNHKADIINMSFAYKDGVFSGANKKYLEELKAICKQTIVVIASGNDHPQKINDGMRALSGIRVGALAVNGVQSDYSQSDEDVDISAPSDYEIQTQSVADDQDGKTYKKLINFSGTSGAAPLVTAALANVMELLPGINLNEAKTLLKKSAFKTAGFNNHISGNGAGALNSYQMIEVANRLRTQKNPGWPENRSLILNDEIYDFTESSKHYFLQAMNLIKEQNKKNKYSIDCPSQELIYNNLRKAIFLNPKNRQAANQLAKLYEINGFHAQADYFKETDPRVVLKKEYDRLVKNNANDLMFKRLAKSAARYSLSPYEFGPHMIKKICEIGDTTDYVPIMTNTIDTFVTLAQKIPTGHVTKLLIKTVSMIQTPDKSKDVFNNLIYGMNDRFNYYKSSNLIYPLLNDLYLRAPAYRQDIVMFFGNTMKNDDFPNEKKDFFNLVIKNGNAKERETIWSEFSGFCRPHKIVEELIIEQSFGKDEKELEKLKKIKECLARID